MHATQALAYYILLVLLALSIVVTLVPQAPPSFFRTRPPPPHLIDGGGTTARADAASGSACDYSDGEWVRDAAAGMAYGEDCPFLDPGFRCLRNGRRDSSFRRWRWQPRGSCHLAKFNATDMLERSRNGRIAFAGDSIGRNQWESMVCMLAGAVPADMNGSRRIYEQSGKPLSRHKGYLSIVFADYNLSVEYYRAPMLVLVDRLNGSAGAAAAARGAVRLDALPRHADRWAGADVLVLNTGHWWNQHKTIKSGNYFTLGDRFNVTTDIKEAFRLSLQTVKHWVLTNDPRRSMNRHLFFRSYSPSHYGNGTWDTGGSCADQRDPLTITAGEGDQEYSWINGMISSAARGVGTVSNNKAVFLNITYMTGLRRDGHPSRHREPGTPPDAPEDCSHWCLPGVPDAWNQVMYGHLVSMGFDTRGRSKHR